MLIPQHTFSPYLLGLYICDLRDMPFYAATFPNITDSSFSDKFI